MTIVSLTNEYKENVERIVVESWGALQIVSHRKLYDLRELPCLIAISDNQEVLGYCYYRICNHECEIMVIESVRFNAGIGSALIEAAMKIAARENCKRLYLVTTNDNTNAFRFYQRRGFTICDFRLNEMDYARKLKPSIPLLGDNDIPLQHEIEFEFVL